MRGVEERARRCLSVLIQATGLWLGVALPARAASAAGPEGWPRVVIVDASVRHALTCALESAEDWLSRPTCQSVLSDFTADDGQTPAQRLDALGATPSAYLRLVLFRDGSRSGACQERWVLAHTTPGSRVVYVCGRQFLDEWRQRPRMATAVVIHEVLHTLGLGENPPSSGEITRRVEARCTPPRVTAGR